MPAHALDVQHVNSQTIFGQPLSIFGVPVNRDAIFTDHGGVYRRGIEKRQRKLIVKTTFIKFYLHQNERIQFLTTAYSPTGPLEQAFTGPAFLIFKRAILIFTDRRLLHVPTRFNRSSHGAISQISYEDCARIQLKGRSLAVGYKNGDEETFLYIGSPEKRKLKSFIKTLPITPKEAGRLQGRVFLCPSCTNPLTEKTKRCPACHLEFKTDFQARIRSIFIPGGGYFYSRYPLMGVVTGLLESALVSYLIFKVTCFQQGIPIRFGMLSLLAFALILEKVIAAFHASRLIRNYLPETNDYAIRKV